MTRHEQRCENVNKTLFEITLDMPEELKLARIGVFNSKIDEEKSNNVIRIIVRRYRFTFTFFATRSLSEKGAGC